MKHGDFTELAKSYVHRTGYAPSVIRMLGQYTGASSTGAQVADVGAGTGKLTENLAEAGLLPLVAVEPNDAMREEGVKYTDQFDVEWRKGSGEDTGLTTGSMRWILMGSSFHWVDAAVALPEFSRVLQPGGFFTALWNPRDLQNSVLHTRIEKRILEIAPHIKRVSSGASKYTDSVAEKLLSTGDFSDVVFTEGHHEVHMTKERYMGAWRSVNDIRVQAGPDCWPRILEAIESEIAELDEVVVPYKTRAWTVQKVA